MIINQKMKKDIHIINKNIGGVSSIVNKLSKKSNILLTSEIKEAIIKIKYGHTIYFHQPKSHLFCLFYSLFFFKKRNNMHCILHEASHYNYKETSIFRFLIGYSIRISTILLLRLMNIKISGVSNFTLNSYFIFNENKVSYLHLFKKEIENLISDKTKKQYETITFWLRKGSLDSAIDSIEKLSQYKKIKNCYVLGDETSVEKLKSYLLGKNINVFKTKCKIPPYEFHEILKKSDFFISPYNKEGFGLSVFEAMAAGCICIAPKAGALPEWLPAENFNIFNSSISLIKISKINKLKALFLLRSSYF